MRNWWLLFCLALAKSKEINLVWSAGAIILAFYGYVMTLQTPSFGKSYVLYGGVFTVMVFNDYS